MEKDREVKCNAQRDKREWLEYQAKKIEEATVHSDEICLLHCQENHQHYPFKIWPNLAKDGKPLSNGEEKLAR